MTSSSLDVLARLDRAVPESEIRNIEASASSAPYEPLRAARVVLSHPVRSPDAGAD